MERPASLVTPGGAVARQHTDAMTHWQGVGFTARDTEPYARAVHRTSAALTALVIMASAGLTACGSDDSGNSSAAQTAATTTAAAPAAPAPETTAAAPASTTTPAAPKKSNAQVVAICHKTFDPFIAELRKIDKQVAGKPNYKTYNAMTTKLEARYAKLRSAQIPSSTCQHQVNVVITSARLAHLGALQIWRQCRERNDCKKTMVTLRKQWRDAHKATNDAVKGFAKVTAS
jgi:hypothetical protein